MNKVDFLIVGGSAAGTTAAETIRGLTPNASICIISDEPYAEYSRVLVPHYVRHKVSREQVFLKKPEWYSEKKIELLKGVRAEGLGSSEKVVKLSNGEEIQFGKLLIAVGGNVVPFSVPGSEKAEILYLRTLDDADKIIEKTKGAKTAVIIGGGFIGLEFCSCFVMNGISDITVLVLEPFFWDGKLDEVSSRVLVGVLEKQGIKIVTNKEIDRIESMPSHPEPRICHSGLDPESLRGRLDSGSDPRLRENDNQRVNLITKNGSKYGADIIGVGIGIKPDLGWLSGSGVKVDRGVLTNEYLETNVSDIYAAGDCAQFWDSIFEREHMLGNWANATSQGLAVGKTMSGQKTLFETASSYSISFFDGSCSFIGVTDEKFANQVVVRGSELEGKMSRIFTKKYGQTTRIVGATVINNPVEVAPLTMVIKGKVDVSAHIDDLGKADFDLKTLLSS